MAPGGREPIWRSPQAKVTRLEDGGILWDRYDLSTVYPSHMAGLLLSQGLRPSDLFAQRGSLFACGATHPGPFLFLAGRMALVSAPPRIFGVVLGHVVHCPCHVDPVALLGRLVEQVLKR